MKLFAVVVSNFQDVKSYSVRAYSPADATRAVLDADDGPRYFQALHVYPLQELAGDVDVRAANIAGEGDLSLDSVNGAEGLASAGGEA
jgi:hypothetical protein